MYTKEHDRMSFGTQSIGKLDSPVLLLVASYLQGPCWFQTCWMNKMRKALGEFNKSLISPLHGSDIFSDSKGFGKIRIHPIVILYQET